MPTFAYEKRLSRIETLRLAITYIAFMGELLGIEPGSPKQEYIPREYYLPNWMSSFCFDLDEPDDAEARRNRDAGATRFAFFNGMKRFLNASDRGNWRLITKQKSSIID